jgi:hypothetical protein
MDIVPMKINSVIFSPRKIMAKKDANRGKIPFSVLVKAAPNLRMPPNKNSLPRNGPVAPANAKNKIAVGLMF